MTDPALVWEAAAIRRTAPHAAGEHGDEGRERRPAHWVTIREAHDRSGVAVSTLRAWARTGKVAGQLTEGRWLISYADVASRADGANRSESPATVPRRQHRARAEAPADDRTMIVPIDAWDRMLAQLGNLHEAGQQLADARERAAKAETEARFLREQLGRLREEGSSASSDHTMVSTPLDQATSTPTSSPTSDLSGEPSADAAPSMDMVRRWVTRMRRNRS